MNLEKLYYEVKKHIDTVDFSKLWKNFKPLKFALYTDTECFFDGEYVEKTEEFLANTSVFYKGEWIAIWYVQEALDPILLASKIVHEMFHGFQRIHNESRFFDNLDALYHYKYEKENLRLKQQENQLLYAMVTHFDKALLETFLQIRKYRFDTFPYAYHYESSIEQIEGTANYAELYCLKQLSAELFEKKLSAMKARITDPGNLLPVRAVCYDIGALLLYVMAENHIAYEEGFTSVPFSEAMIKDVEGKACASQNGMGELLDRFYEKAGAVIDKAIEKNALVSDSPCDLLAVNVYDAVYYKNHITSRYFVMFGSQDAPRVEYGDFVIETDAYKKATRIYKV